MCRCTQRRFLFCAHRSLRYEALLSWCQYPPCARSPLLYTYKHIRLELTRAVLPLRALPIDVRYKGLVQLGVEHLIPSVRTRTAADASARSARCSGTRLQAQHAHVAAKAKHATRTLSRVKGIINRRGSRQSTATAGSLRVSLVRAGTRIRYFLSTCPENGTFFSQAATYTDRIRRISPIEIGAWPWVAAG